MTDPESSDVKSSHDTVDGKSEVDVIVEPWLIRSSLKSATTEFRTFTFWSRPHLAKRLGARLRPTGFSDLGQFDFGQSAFIRLRPEKILWTLQFQWWGPCRWGPRRVGAPGVGEGPKFRVFSLSRHNFLSLFSLVVWSSRLSCEAPAAPKLRLKPPFEAPLEKVVQEVLLTVWDEVIVNRATRVGYVSLDRVDLVSIFKLSCVGVALTEADHAIAAGDEVRLCRAWKLLLLLPKLLHKPSRGGLIPKEKLKGEV